jgi:hypothetical protein
VAEQQVPDQRLRRSSAPPGRPDGPGTEREESAVVDEMACTELVDRVTEG